MATLRHNPHLSPIRIGASASGTVTTFALDSAFVYGASGDSISFEHFARESDTLTHFYFYVTAVTGTLGNIQVTCEVRNDSSGNPGSTVHATQTTTCNGAATWSRVTFGTPYSFVTGTKYHIVLSNSSGAPTTDYPTVARTVSRFTNNDPNDLTGRSSTDGTTWGASSSSGIQVLKFSAQDAIGVPYTSATTSYASNTRERGFYIAARAVDWTIYEVRLGANTSVNGGKILLAATGSSGETPGAGEYAGGYESTNATVKFGADAVLLADQAYRIVLTFSGNSTSPQYFEVNDRARYTDVQDAAYLDGIIYGTIGDGAGGWTDSPGVMPRMELLIRSIETPAASGGSGYSRGRVI